MDHLSNYKYFGKLHYVPALQLGEVNWNYSIGHYMAKLSFHRRIDHSASLSLESKLRYTRCWNVYICCQLSCWIRVSTSMAALRLILALNADFIKESKLTTNTYVNRFRVNGSSDVCVSNF